MQGRIVMMQMSNKIYTFSVNPSHLGRVYYKKSENAVIIQDVIGNSVYVKLEKGEYENYIRQFKDYCMKKRIGFTVEEI